MKITDQQVIDELRRRGLRPDHTSCMDIECAWVYLKQQDPTWVPRYATRARGAGLLNKPSMERLERISEAYVDGKVL